MGPLYRFGIEEEYFLAAALTRGTPRRTQPFHDAVHARVPSVERELLTAQVEVATSPTDSPAAARAQLTDLRAGLAETGREHGLLVLASGTQPLARWDRQRQTRKPRYDRLMQQMQMLGRRNVVCGMHVHVEVPRPAERVDLMNRMLPYMPLLLALSASSPFWQGRDTGIAAYRLSVWGEMPRTGLPDLFDDAADYDRYVAAMTRSGAIADASFLWWTLRPSIHYPTLELRVADSCTRLDDTLAIAALYRCLVRLLTGRRPSTAGKPAPRGRSPPRTFGGPSAMASVRSSWTWKAARRPSPPGLRPSCRRWRPTRRRWAARPSWRGCARSRQRARAPTGRSPCSRQPVATPGRRCRQPLTGLRPRQPAPRPDPALSPDSSGSHSHADRRT